MKQLTLFEPIVEDELPFIFTDEEEKEYDQYLNKVLGDKLVSFRKDQRDTIKNMIMFGTTKPQTITNEK